MEPTFATPEIYVDVLQFDAAVSPADTSDNTGIQSERCPDNIPIQLTTLLLLALIRHSTLTAHKDQGDCKHSQQAQNDLALSTNQIPDGQSVLID